MMICACAMESCILTLRIVKLPATCVCLETSCLPSMPGKVNTDTLKILTPHCLYSLLA